MWLFGLVEGRCMSVYSEFTELTVETFKKGEMKWLKIEGV